ncbi:MAG: beta-lactamase family protein [Nocardiopsaceae bacterium]|nr:beta-lactamase family protein [Nocardiopsaceae bacterium]
MAEPDPPEPGDRGLDEIGRIIAAAVEGDGIPGVVAAAGRGSSTLGTWAAGLADTTPGAERAMATGTVFDLASLTKVVSTTTVVLALAAAGEFRLDDPAGRYLPSFTALREAGVTIRQLLAHTSGLPSTVKFYERCASRKELLDRLFVTPLQVPPGTRVAYSDLGFMALGEMVSSVAGEPLDAVFRRVVSEPLGLAETGFLPAGPPSRFAATEFRDDGTPWTGVVHDENARVMDGVAGHAGLFSTAADLARFAAWWVSSGDVDVDVVPVASRREAESCQTPGLEGDGGMRGRRGLGWVKPGDRFDILAGAWPSSAVSHTGFTGASVALDSASGAWLVVATNRVHASRDPAAIRAFRHALHTAAAQALLPALPAHPRKKWPRRAGPAPASTSPTQP